MLDGGLHLPDVVLSTMQVARNEYEETGTFTVSTYTALNNEGYNADIVLAQFTGEKEHG